MIEVNEESVAMDKNIPSQCNQISDLLFKYVYFKFLILLVFLNDVTPVCDPFADPVLL